MALIKSFHVIPPGSWRYVQPETGVRFHSDFSFAEIADQVRKHREYKGLPVDTVEVDIQRQMCAGLTDNHCKPEPGEDWQPVKDLTAELTTEMAKSLGKAVLAFVLTGGEFVPKTEAAARANVCRGCPFNKPATLCACSSVYGVMEKLIPPDRREPGVSVCMACGCSLQAKVNLPAEVIQKSLPAEITLPKWCWQRNPGTPLSGS
jgi:hypothetical protein